MELPGILFCGHIQSVGKKMAEILEEGLSCICLCAKMHYLKVEVGIFHEVSLKTRYPEEEGENIYGVLTSAGHGAR